jgi:hypothetical protein
MTLAELLAESLRLRAQLEDMMRTPAATTQAPASGLLDSEAIFQKPVGTWTQLEKDHVRGEVTTVLRDLSR